jgi:hypothetical protein
MYNFDDRIELLRTVSKVAIRQLAVQRTPEMMDSIYRYAAEPPSPLLSRMSCSFVPSSHRGVLLLAHRFIDEVQGRPFQKNRLTMVKAWSGLNTYAAFPFTPPFHQ